MQKTSSIILIFLAVIFSAKAQTSQGSMTVGGDVSVQSTSVSGGGSTTNTSFSPSFGYFISDRLLLGGALGVTNSSSSGSPTTNSFSITPFIRFYKFTADDKFAFFGQGAVGYSTQTGQNGTVSITVRPGFAYFFTPRWGLDFLLPGLSYSNGNKTTSFGLSASLSPGLGFRYYFGGK